MDPYLERRLRIQQAVDRVGFPIMHCPALRGEWRLSREIQFINAFFEVGPEPGKLSLICTPPVCKVHIAISFLRPPFEFRRHPKIGSAIKPVLQYVGIVHYIRFQIIYGPARWRSGRDRQAHPEILRSVIASNTALGYSFPGARPVPRQCRRRTAGRCHLRKSLFSGHSPALPSATSTTPFH